MAVGHIKRSVQTGAELPLQDALALERELQSLLFKSEDAKEGLAAYNEKRVARLQEQIAAHRPLVARLSLCFGTSAKLPSWDASPP